MCILNRSFGLENVGRAHRSVRRVAMYFLMIFQRENFPEIFTAFSAVKIILLVTLLMLVKQILAREGPVADRARELVRVHMQDIVSRQIVQSRILPRANVTGELGPLRVTSAMVLQVPLFGESLLAGATGDLIAIVLLHVHVTRQFLARRKILLTEDADELLRLLVPLYVLQEIWIGHNLVQKRVLQFIIRLGGGT